LDWLRLRVVFVDDHSDDQSGAIIRQASAQADWIGYVRLARRFGSHVAIVAGFDQCREDCAAYISADLQDPPDLLAQMVKLCEQKFDVVWAVRNNNDKHGRLDAAGSKLYHTLLRARMLPYRATFVLLSRHAYRQLVRNCGKWPSLHVDIARLRLRTTSVTYHRPPRVAGRSKWTFARKTLALCNAVVSSAGLLRHMRNGPVYRIEGAAEQQACAGDA
jgi:dolichol-phosphate mannosyltransferase